MSELTGTPDPSRLGLPVPEFVESTEFDSQSEFLARGKHIVDQFPYKKLFDVAPPDFFQNPKSHRSAEGNLFGFLTSLGRLQLFLPKPLSEISYSTQFFENNKAKNLLKYINKTNKRKRVEIFQICKDIYNEMMKYPFSFQYLFDKSGGFDFDGNPRIPKDPAPWYKSEMTFARYQHGKTSNAKLPRSIEFAEEGPRKRSRFDAIPIKPYDITPSRATYPLLIFSESRK